MTEPAPITVANLLAARTVLAAVGVPGAATAAAFRNPTRTQPCTHPDGCTNTATHQIQRDATETEASAHWDAVEQNIRASGNPDHVQNRNDTVTVAEFRCDAPQHADPAYLEAKAREENTDA